MPTPKLDLKELRAIAESASEVDVAGWWDEETLYNCKLNMSHDDSRFVATITPLRTLALLDRLAEADEHLRMNRLCRTWCLACERRVAAYFAKYSDPKETP